MVTSGGNTGRIGVVTSRERHPGQFDIVHLKDAVGVLYIQFEYKTGPARARRRTLVCPHVRLSGTKSTRMSGQQRMMAYRIVTSLLLQH